MGSGQGYCLVVTFQARLARGTWPEGLICHPWVLVLFEIGILSAEARNVFRFYFEVRILAAARRKPLEIIVWRSLSE